MPKTFNNFTDLAAPLKGDNELLWAGSNYGNDLGLRFEDALSAAQPGENHPAIVELMQKPYIKIQLDSLNKFRLIKELADYGAWSDNDLADHAANLERWLWLSCGFIVDEHYSEVTHA